jgi:hypothetical protein
VKIIAMATIAAVGLEVLVTVSPLLVPWAARRYQGPLL